jgi:hypothetical protein
LNGENFGVSRDSVLIVRVEPKGRPEKHPGDHARLDRTYRDLLERIETIPGVRSASLAQATPTSPNPRREDKSRCRPARRSRAAGDALFEVLLDDRTCRWWRAASSARRISRRTRRPGVSSTKRSCASVSRRQPLRKPCITNLRPSARDATGPRYPNPPEPYQIIGVVKDSRYSNPRGETQPVIYTTFLQTGTGRGQMVLHVRVAGDPRLVVPRIREEILRVDSTLPTFDVHTLDQEMGAALIQEHLIAMLSSLFGGLALLLASVGLYGLLAFAVVQRTNEMGIRMAVGARRIDVVWMVIREALVLVTIGVLIGCLAGARFASSQISGLLYGISTDPVTIPGGVFVNCGAAVASTFRQDELHLWTRWWPSGTNSSTTTSLARNPKAIENSMRSFSYSLMRLFC